MSPKDIIIKSLLLICSLIAASLISGGCKKEAGQGLIKFTVVYINQPVTNAIIHVKGGTLTDPGILIDQYQAHLTADGFGEYWYKNVQPGDYFFYATARINGVAVCGTANLQLKERYRHNTYEVVINMK
jgi:hypothetical protein